MNEINWTHNLKKALHRKSSILDRLAAQNSVISHLLRGPETVSLKNWVRMLSSVKSTIIDRYLLHFLTFSLPHYSKLMFEKSMFKSNDINTLITLLPSLKRAADLTYIQEHFKDSQPSSVLFNSRLQLSELFSGIYMTKSYNQYLDFFDEAYATLNWQSLDPYYDAYDHVSPTMDIRQFIHTSLVCWGPQNTHALLSWMQTGDITPIPNIDLESIWNNYESTLHRCRKKSILETEPVLRSLYESAFDKPVPYTFTYLDRKKRSESGEMNIADLQYQSSQSQLSSPSETPKDEFNHMEFKQSVNTLITALLNDKTELLLSDKKLPGIHKPITCSITKEKVVIKQTSGTDTKTMTYLTKDGSVRLKDKIFKDKRVLKFMEKFSQLNEKLKNKQIQLFIK